MQDIIDAPIVPRLARASIRVELYTVAECPYCLRAKVLLQTHDIRFIEHRLDGDDERRRWVEEHSGGRRVLPQLFINNRHLGGFYELNRMSQQGTLRLMVYG